VKRQKILIITDDAIGASMAGPAIRAWNIAILLAEHHDVRLASTRRAAASSPHFAVCDGSGGNLGGLAAGQDIIVLQGFTLRTHPWLLEVGAKLVIDLYDPIHLEILEGSQDAPPAQRTAMMGVGLEALNIQLENGDFFLCATERQRDLWLGYLSALGRVNPSTYRQDKSLRRLIDIAPFGIPDEPPPARTGALRGSMPGIGADDQLLLWAGGVYNWFDPLTLVEAVSKLVPELPRLRLVFMGTKHPSLDDLSTTVLRQAIDLARDLGVLDTHVFFREGWVPYDERGRFLADADIGVSTHYLHVETAYSFRTRMLDYLWAGLPIVCTEGDEFATLVARHGLGRAVPAEDSTALADALRELLTDAEQARRARAAVRELAPSFTWRRVLAPLAAYCDDPWPAADRRARFRPVAAASRPRSRFGLLTDQIRAYHEVHGLRRLLVRGSRRAVLAALARARRR
jgi:glycosyltransferase involved in cell wall biosynthesis